MPTLRRASSPFSTQTRTTTAPTTDVPTGLICSTVFGEYGRADGISTSHHRTSLMPSRQRTVCQWTTSMPTTTQFLSMVPMLNTSTTHALYYKDAFFTAGKNEYFPIASNQMNYVQGLYHQNKGY